MKKTLLALAIAGAAVSAQADVKISGHVSYAAGDISDFEAGTDSFSVTPGETSKSRFRIVASKEADGITYASSQEFGINTGGSLDVRKNELWIKGDFGKISLGQGGESSDDGTEQDYSGTYLGNGDYDTWNLGGDLSFSTIDGGRTERLRYDSATGPVKFSVDLQDDDDVVGAVSYKTDNLKLKVYHESRDVDSSHETGASVAFKLGAFNAAIAAANRDGAASAGATTEYRRLIVGYRVGKISVAADFATDKLDDNSRDLSTQGLTLVYRPTGGVEFFGAVRSVENDVLNVKGNGFLVGGRVKF